jgi:hypothetical protein
VEGEDHTLGISIHRFGDGHVLELSHTDPDSQARVESLRAGVTFDPLGLLALQASPAEYGAALARQLFADGEVERRFLEVETAAQSKDRRLRLVLAIDRSAQELAALRWELLRHPRSGALLSTSERLVLSRFMASVDWRPVKLRARTETTALVAVAAPSEAQLLERRLAPVRFDEEVARVRAALGAVKSRVLGSPELPVTLDRLIGELRDGVDVLYLVSHGMFGSATGTAALILQDDAGDLAVVKGDDLASRVAELSTPPRLVVLASCQSAGDGQPVGPARPSSVQATLAGRLADAGVPAIVAMQGFVSQYTVETMMPVFFAELLRDGRVDRALAVARGRVRDQPDAWMPALYMRLINGLLWYTPGFHARDSAAVWRRLLKPVRAGRVVPILGPRLLEPVHGASHDTALGLASASQFPLARHEWDDLPRVTEYISIKERSRFNALEAYKDRLQKDLLARHAEWLPAAKTSSATGRPELRTLLALVGDHLREHDEADPYRILAEFPASVYLTTNFDSLLERALKAKERAPQQVVTRWRHQRASASAQELPEPSAKAPLVYHAFGAFGASPDEGLVFTADDYFDYLIKASADKLMPDEVGRALGANSLLFLGFRLTDWHFRVLFRLMLSLPSSELLRKKEHCHVAVQVDPDLQTMADATEAKRYLAEYFGQEANVEIYWGSTEEFLKALRDELAAAGELPTEMPAEKDEDDGWF